jgi:hypothetical protein
LRNELVSQNFTLKSGPSGIHARLAGDACRERLKQSVDAAAIAMLVARLAASQGGRASVS